MWARNLLLVGVALAAVAAYRYWVWPPHGPRHQPQISFGAAAADDVGPIVAAVDAAFADSWQQAGVQPAPRADDLTIARRMSLALLGTIPSLEEIRVLESLPAAERLDRHLRTILADRRSADYRAERLARTLLGNDDGPLLLFRRRRFVSWLADGLLANRPYDDMLRHVIADAGIWTDTPSINFITAAVKPDSDEDPDPVRLAGRLARGMLGVRLDCAECHDHPFQPWKQRDFQGLAACFAQTRRTPTGIRDRAGEFEAENRRTGKRETIAPAVPFQADLLPDTGTRRQRLAAWVTNCQNRSFARAQVNRTWALLLGRGLVDPIDDLTQLADAPPPAALDILATDFAEHGYDLRRLLRVIVATRVFQLDSRGPANDSKTTSADSAQAETRKAETNSQQHDWSSFPLSRLRPEQMAAGVLQSGSLQTLNYESHILIRVASALRTSGFIGRYGDLGADEFVDRGGTVQQRLLMMNGELVRDKTKPNIVANAATQIGALAPTDEQAVDVALLVVLTRHATPAETRHFARRLAGTRGQERSERLEDLYWSLLNSTEFAWNH